LLTVTTSAPAAPIGNKFNYVEATCLHLLSKEVTGDTSRLVKAMLQLESNTIIGTTVRGALSRLPTPNPTTLIGGDRFGVSEATIEGISAAVAQSLRVTATPFASDIGRRSRSMSTAALGFICNLRDCCYIE